MAEPATGLNMVQVYIRVFQLEGRVRQLEEERDRLVTRIERLESRTR